LNAAEFNGWLENPPPRKPLVMGVLNLTPDSFSDGGRFDSIESAVAHAQALAAAGADIIDIGGESARPGSMPVPPQEQIHRVIPAIRALADRSIKVVISIDTTSAQVARAAVDAGAGMINDISAGRDDPAMLSLGAQCKLPIILMHMQGTPATMQQNPAYREVGKEVRDFLIERRQAACDAGIDRAHILLDPGIGFGKTDEHNLELLRQTGSFAQLGSPLVIGASRKGFIGRITGELDAADRVFGTAAVVAWCVANGTGIVRVHDVGAMNKIVQMIAALIGNPWRPHQPMP
jgi:dihydropteroate synthase